MKMLKEKTKKLRRTVYLYVCAGLLCIVMSGCARESVTVSGGNPDSHTENTQTEDSQPQDTQPENPKESDSEDSGKNEEVTVYVCGCVANPGVYVLSAGSRVNDALDAAGGFLESADRNAVNLADKIDDGQKLYFPAEGESVAETPGTEESAGDGGLININEAGVDRLTELPGVGATRARQIVEYRQSQGRFSCKEDLMNVSGIGETTYKKLESYITVD